MTTREKLREEVHFTAGDPVAHEPPGTDPAKGNAGLVEAFGTLDVVPNSNGGIEHDNGRGMVEYRQVAPEYEEDAGWKRAASFAADAAGPFNDLATERREDASRAVRALEGRPHPDGCSDTAVSWALRHGDDARAALDKLSSAENRALNEGEQLIALGLQAYSEAAVTAARTMMAEAVERTKEAVESPAAEQAALEWQGLPPALQGFPNGAETRAKAEADSAYAWTLAERHAGISEDADVEIALVVGHQASDRDMHHLEYEGNAQLHAATPNRPELESAGRAALHALTAEDALGAGEMIGVSIASKDTERAAITHATVSAMTEALVAGVNELAAAQPERPGGNDGAGQYSVEHTRSLLESLGEAPDHTGDDDATDAGRMLQDLLWEKAKEALEDAAQQTAPSDAEPRHRQGEALLAMARTEAVTATAPDL